MFKTPISEKGNAVFKLDQIASLNGISHENAHDAMGDVLATLGMAKIIAKKPQCLEGKFNDHEQTRCKWSCNKRKNYFVNEYFGKA